MTVESYSLGKTPQLAEALTRRPVFFAGFVDNVFYGLRKHAWIDLVTLEKDLAAALSDRPRAPVHTHSPDRYVRTRVPAGAPWHLEFFETEYAQKIKNPIAEFTELEEIDPDRPPRFFALKPDVPPEKLPEAIGEILGRLDRYWEEEARGEEGLADPRDLAIELFRVVLRMFHAFAENIDLEAWMGTL